MPDRLAKEQIACYTITLLGPSVLLLLFFLLVSFDLFLSYQNLVLYTSVEFSDAFMSHNEILLAISIKQFDAASQNRCNTLSAAL